MWVISISDVKHLEKLIYHLNKSLTQFEILAALSNVIISLLYKICWFSYQYMAQQRHSDQNTTLRLTNWKVYVMKFLTNSSTRLFGFSWFHATIINIITVILYSIFLSWIWQKTKYLPNLKPWNASHIYFHAFLTSFILYMLFLTSNFTLYYASSLFLLFITPTKYNSLYLI